MNGAIDIQEVKVALQDDITRLCRELLPSGRAEGRTWVAHNPITQDHKKTRAFKVNMNGSSAGAWKDWRSGNKGDVLGLIAYCNSMAIKDMKFARAWGMDWLGMRSMSREERAENKKRAVKRKATAKDDDKKQRLKKIEAGKKRWEQAEESWQEWEKAGGGVLMPVQKHFFDYMAGRNVDLHNVKNIDPLTFRFARSSEYWKSAVWKTVNGRLIKEKSGPNFPAMHTAMRGRFGSRTACHVTWFDPILPEKAPVEKPKLVRGEAKFAFISVTHGPSNKNPYIEQKPGLVAVAEGIETAFTIAEAMPEARVWAAGSLNNFGTLPVDAHCVGEIVICRDNNAGNEIAQAQFDTVYDALCEHGKPVTVINSPVGDDFNDLAQDDNEEDE